MLWQIQSFLSAKLKTITGICNLYYLYFIIIWKFDFVNALGTNLKNNDLLEEKPSFFFKKDDF